MGRGIRRRKGEVRRERERNHQEEINQGRHPHCATVNVDSLDDEGSKKEGTRHQRKKKVSHRHDKGKNSHCRLYKISRGKGGGILPRAFIA